MGLDKFKSDKGSKREYVRIDRDEFENFLNEISDEWKIVTNVSDAGSEMREFSKEYIYEIPLKTRYENLVMRIYSTIDSRTDEARDKGSDAIRCVIWDNNIRRPIGGRKKTLRIKTWKKNLRGKIQDIRGELDEYLEKCDECDDGWMVEREGEYGKFLGCTSYPRCENTRQIE